MMDSFGNSQCLSQEWLVNVDEAISLFAEPHRISGNGFVSTVSPEDAGMEVVHDDGSSDILYEGSREAFS